ncbi:glycosyltransferase [Cupriavidus sp. WGtm5]|uniref:glycosyltransferase n=1 Tax=Cupriavidus sp. WGtm5 TaxID=2919926 RepID=UPI0020907762|nr:glycosyltransferase [Cupriavidus sp. WGtm5]MCO4888766.1 glycosyltransferase [Cupriavidus sp. WGtm5]
MRQVLFVCNDTVGHRMAGPAIRCIELAKTLAGDFDVVVAARNLDESYVPPIKLIAADSDTVAAAAAQADVVVVQGDALRRNPALLEIKGALVADMYCPIPLEYHMSSTGVPESVRLEHGWHVSRLMQEQLFYADYFLCASERQMDFWSGALTMAGRINAISMPDGIRTGLEHFVACVPFGLSDETPVANAHPLREKFNIPQDEFLMVWGGGIYEWFDPVTIIKAIAKLEREGLRSHLVFLGVKHPNPGIADHDKLTVAVQTSRDLGVLDRLVHFNFGWVEYSRRHEYLMDADVGVSAHLDNAETRFSFRTRMLDYLWCGLPIVATRGDEFGEIVGREGLGIATDYENSDDWVSAIRRMVTDDAFRAQCRNAVAETRERYRWSEVVRPMRQVFKELAASPDRAYARRRAAEVGFQGSAAAPIPPPSIMSRVRAVYAQRGLVGLVRAIVNRVRREVA